MTKAEKYAERAADAVTEEKRKYWQARAAEADGTAESRPVRYFKRFKGITKKQKTAAIKGHKKELRRVESVYDKSPALQYLVSELERAAAEERAAGGVPEPERRPAPAALLAPLVAPNAESKDPAVQSGIETARRLFDAEELRLVGAGRIPKRSR